jgi:hypothetical protein
MVAKASLERAYTAKSDTKAIQHHYETNDRTVAKKKYMPRARFEPASLPSTPPPGGLCVT